MGTVARAGLGRRQIARGASPHAPELDEEDDEEGIIPPCPSGAPPATSKDGSLSRPSQQGGGIAPSRPSLPGEAAHDQGDKRGRPALVSGRDR